MNRFLTIGILILALAGYANAGDMTHPSLPPAVHNGEPCLLGQAACGATGTTTGIINVQAAFGCKGDGSTDDTACQQAAIVASCGGTISAPINGPHPEVYWPYTANFYAISSPLHQPCGQQALDGPHQGTLARIKYLPGYFGPVMLAELYGQAHPEFGASLFSAGGNSLNLKSYNYDSLGKVDYTPMLNGKIGQMSGQTKFRINYVLELTSLTGGGGDKQFVWSSTLTQESTAVDGATSPGWDTYLSNVGVFHATMNFSGGVVTFATFTPVINTRYEVSLNSDGAGHCYEFINGVQNGSTQSCSGSLVMDPYEIVEAPTNGTVRWPRYGNNFQPAWGFIDAIDVEAGSSAVIHTTNYTPNTTTKPTSTASTLLLDNFLTPTAQTQDTDPVYVGVGVNGQPNAFFPVVMANGVGQTAYNHISYLDLDSGLFVSDEFQDEIDHIFVSENQFIGIDMAHNSFESSVHDNNILGGQLCINYGSGYSEGVAGFNLCGQAGPNLHTCYVSDSASYVGIYEQCQDNDSPGDIMLPFIDGQSHDTHQFPFDDAEGFGSAAMKASFGYIFGSYAPETLVNVEGNTRNNAPMLIQGAGAPTRVEGLDWASEVGAEVVDVLTPLPSGPVQLVNSILPAGVAISNLPSYVDTLDDVLDNNLPVTNILNGGLTTSNVVATTVAIGTTGYLCQQNGQANNATAVIPRPPCSQPGTVEVCIAQIRGIPTVALSGWTQIGSTTPTGDNNSEAAAWWRLAPANESSTISITGATQQITAICGVMGGVDPVIPIITSNTATVNFSSSPVVVIAPALTTGNANSIILSFAEFSTNAGFNVVATGAPANSTPFQFVAASFTDLLSGAVWGLGGTTSAAVTYTYTAGGGQASAVAFSIAFNPASTLGSPAPAMPINPTDVAVGNGLSAANLRFSTVYSVAGTPIPAAGAANAHTAACVSDSTACTLGGTYAGSSTNNCHLHSNGTNWIEDGFGC